MPTEHALTSEQPKQLRLTLAPAEWKTLRVWAAEDDTSMQALVAEIVRSALLRHGGA
jgi:hypothetical protein